MGDPGNFKADIPMDAIADALRSVGGTAAPEVTVDVEGAPAGEGAAPGEEHAEIRKLRFLLDELTSRASQTQERLKETHERYLRVAADFDNWKKRASREKDDAQKFAIERLLKDILPVADNLDRAVAAEQQDPKIVLEGVRLTIKLLQDTLGRHGVKPFTALGQAFDPNRHEALMQQESSTVAPGTVLSEMVRGYLLHDRLVRPAAVVVAKAPADAGAVASDGQSSNS